MNAPRKAHLIGGGIGSLAAAAFMIRDGGMPGKDITIYEAGEVFGGSLDGAGDPVRGYSLRGGRMLTTDNYECTWDLYKSIPSLVHAAHSVFDETLAFNDQHRPCAMARLVDRHRAKVPVSSMGFSMQDRIELLKLSNADEFVIDASRITDWFSPAFFGTEFWFMWATTFAFQPWHSAVEFRRYLHRFVLEFSRLETLGGVKRTVYNQYDSLVRPLTSWLEGHGVRLVASTCVTGLFHDTDSEQFTVTALQCERAGFSEIVNISKCDLVFLQNASITDASSVGTMDEAPAQLTKVDSNGWRLWEQLANGRPQFGNPSAFNGCVAQSCWESFTVTLKDARFFDAMFAFSGNAPGTGGLVTFKDSNWLMSIVLAHQPHFADQPPDVQVFWGYSLFPDRVGDFVAKPMADCNGAEILKELCGHLRFEFESVVAANCIPCRLPYITSMLMPRERGDRPPPIPAGCTNLAFVSQFVEIADDVVFTIEYSIRAAQMAVYQLMQIEREVPPVQRHDRTFRAQFDAVVKAFR